MRRLPRIALVAAAALAAGASLFLLLRPRAASTPRLDETIAVVDSALAGGSLPAASEALQSVRVMPAREADQLRLLKRALLLGNLSGDYRVMAELAGRVAAAGGRGARVGALTAYAMMRVGRLADAERALPRRGLAAEVRDPLAGESALRRGSAWTGSGGLTGNLLALLQSRAPAAFTDAARRAGDARLSLDAALLEMEAGNRARASAIVRADLDDPAFDEPGGMILYDSGSYPKSIEKLSRVLVTRPARADIAFVLADAYDALGKEARSEALLKAGVPAAPQLSWTPYSNLATFALGRGDAIRAAKWVDDGLAFFPGSRDLLLARARIDARSARPAPAMEILSRLVEEHPADGEPSLLLLDLQSPGSSPEQHRARLWKLFNRIPADKAVFLSLATALVSAHDWDGASIAVRQHEEAGGRADSQTLLLEGMIDAMRGDDTGAEEVLRRSASTTRDGVARYDLALVLIRRGKTHAALDELAVAAQEQSQAGDPAQRGAVLSRIEMVGGSVRMLDGDTTGARSALLRSLAWDPGNLRAALMLRKLEAGGQ